MTTANPLEVSERSGRKRRLWSRVIDVMCSWSGERGRRDVGLRDVEMWRSRDVLCGRDGGGGRGGEKEK